MGQKGTVFESSGISETEGVICPVSLKNCPSKLYMNLTSIPTCMNFLSRFRSIKFFDDHGLYIAHGSKGKFGRF